MFGFRSIIIAAIVVLTSYKTLWASGKSRTRRVDHLTPPPATLLPFAYSRNYRHYAFANARPNVATTNCPSSPTFVATLRPLPTTALSVAFRIEVRVEGPQLVRHAVNHPRALPKACQAMLALKLVNYGDS